MQVEIFSSDSPKRLKREIIEWLASHPNIRNVNPQFSTSSESDLIEYRDRPEMVGPVTTQYSAAIWYEEV